MRRWRWGSAAIAVGLASLTTAAVAQNELDQPPGAVLEPPRGSPGTGGEEQPRYPLQPTRDGGYVYNGTPFSARIAPDGSVTFSAHHFHLIPDATNPSAVGIDTVTPQDPISGRFPAPAIPSMPGVTFDVTDEYMRLLGKDPAAQQKLDFLTATFDMRMDLAVNARRVQRQRALDELPDQLASLWRDSRFTPEQRFQRLQAMWNDLSSEPEADPARRVISAFAQEHLPAREAALFQ